MPAVVDAGSGVHTGECLWTTVSLEQTTEQLRACLDTSDIEKHHKVGVRWQLAGGGWSAGLVVLEEECADALPWLAGTVYQPNHSMLHPSAGSPFR